eukprot:5953635-Pyramimonas_sp.AAC.1
MSKQNGPSQKCSENTSWTPQKEVPRTLFGRPVGTPGRLATAFHPGSPEIAGHRPRAPPWPPAARAGPPCSAHPLALP